MPTPQLNGRTKSRERPTYSEMVWEQIQDTRTEVRETRKELNARMDRLEEEMKTTRQELNARIGKLEEELRATRQELNASIKDLHNEIKSSTNHGQIATISTVGIALAVIYSLLSR